MITINSETDINWDAVLAVAYDNETVTIGMGLLDQVAAGRMRFEALIKEGKPCYGVTTGLGDLVNQNLSEAERNDLPHNILRARAAAIGDPLPKPVARALMMIKLFNFLSGRDGVSVKLCRFLVERLNDGFTPWIPKFGHGMGADATANTHAFQTFIGEGYVIGPKGERQTAADALAERGVAPIQLGQKEGLALLNGIAAAPAYAIEAYHRVKKLLDLATTVAAVSIEGCASPKDSFDPFLKSYSQEPGVDQIIDQLQPLLANSEIPPYKLQAGISYRIVPQVHGACLDALAGLKARIEASLQTFSDNPLMTDDQFLSVGLFHNQHLVNQVDQIALAIAHVAVLSVRRLHRLLSPLHTGLNPQLAARPGLDAGLVVAHKAALGIEARVKILANPVSIHTGESSLGQEDYMSMAIPTIDRIFDLAELVRMILAYELMGGLTALNWRSERVGDGVEQFRLKFKESVPPLTKDRSPGPNVEKILELIKDE